MDFSQSWTKICNILFLYPGIVVGIIGFLTVTNAFVMRYSLDRVQCKNVTVQNSQGSKVYNLNSKLFHRNRTGEEDCTKTLQGEMYNVKFNQQLFEKSWDHLRILMMLSFYVGYALSHRPGAILVASYGSKRISVILLTLTVILTVITPYVVDSYGVKALICLRFFMGLTEGPLVLAVLNLTSQRIQNRHSASLERTMSLTGGHIGILFINLISATLEPYMEWPIISYSLGTCTILWFISFLTFFINNPESNNHVEDEKNLYPSYNNESVNSSFYQLSHSFETWNHLWYNPNILAVISIVIQHEWTQSLIITEVHRLMDDLMDCNIWNNYYSCWKVFTIFFMSWLLVVVTDVLGNILVMRNILTITEAIHFRNVIVSFGPKICSDFVMCLMSSESNNVITAYNCAIGVISTYYMGIKLSSLDINTHYDDTLMNLANDIATIITIMAPYLEVLSRKEGPLENVRSLVWFICTLFSSENIQIIDEPMLETGAIYSI